MVNSNGATERRRRGSSSFWFMLVAIAMASSLTYLCGWHMIEAQPGDGTKQRLLNYHSEELGEDAIDFKAERRKSFEYVKSIKDTRRKLMFLHIPKAAGTTIEEIGGLQAGQSTWGSCGFVHYPKRSSGACQYPPNQFTWPKLIGWWHLPSQLFPLLGVNPYDRADVFVVMREPRDRLVSEFRYVCRLRNVKYHDLDRCDASRASEPAYMNEWLRRRLREHGDGGAEQYLRENGHFTPQSEFVVSSATGARMADYVLRLGDEGGFAALMDAYGLPARLSTKMNAASNSDALTVADLDETTNELIKKVYGKDLELFQKLG